MHYSKVDKVCKHCGIKLKLNNQRDVNRKNFCSHGCRQKWRYAHGDSHWDQARLLSLTPENIRRRNLPKGPKECKHCSQLFNPDSARQNYCKTCVPDRTFQSRMWRYHISKPDWDKLLDQQGGTCALCNEPPFAVDHCHTTGRVRGLLCNGCNILLDKVHTGWCERALAYLDKQ